MTVDDARVEAARRLAEQVILATGGSLHRAAEAAHVILAAADAMRGDQQGASPSGSGWSAEPEPVPVSAAGGDHPSRDQWRPIETAPKDEVIGVAGGCAYWNSDEGRWYSITGEEWPGRPIEWPVTHYKRLSPKTLPRAPAIEARSAKTQGGSAEGESASGEAGAPDAEVWKGLQAGTALIVRQIARERDEARAEVERLKADNTRLAAALASARAQMWAQSRRADEADARRIALEQGVVHPALAIDLQEHRQQAYECGWNDGYAEGAAKPA